MQKPYQTKKPITADNDDLYEASMEALDSIASAMEALRGYWELDHIFDALGSVYDDLKDRFDEYKAIASEEQRKESDALLRDYYRSVV